MLVPVFAGVVFRIAFIRGVFYQEKLCQAIHIGRE